MKASLFLITAICLGFVTATAQTLKPNDKNVDECFKRSSKTPNAFDICVREEIARLREEARPKSESERQSIALLKSGKKKDLEKLFYLGLEQLKESRERLRATPGSERYVTDYPEYFPTFYPRTYYFRHYPRFYPRLHYVPRYFPRFTYRY